MAGVSRSVTIVIAYLLKKYKYSLSQVISIIQRKRRKVNVLWCRSIQIKVLFSSLNSMRSNRVLIVISMIAICMMLVQSLMSSKHAENQPLKLERKNVICLNLNHHLKACIKIRQNKINFK